MNVHQLGVYRKVTKQAAASFTPSAQLQPTCFCIINALLMFYTCINSSYWFVNVKVVNDMESCYHRVHYSKPCSKKHIITEQCLQYQNIERTPPVCFNFTTDNSIITNLLMNDDFPTEIIISVWYCCCFASWCLGNFGNPYFPAPALQ